MTSKLMNLSSMKIPLVITDQVSIDAMSENVPIEESLIAQQHTIPDTESWPQVTFN
jgi:hypothetical protein